MGDVGYGGVQVEAWVVGGEEGRGFGGDEAVVAARVEDEVVRGAELVEGEVFTGDAEDERAGFR